MAEIHRKHKPALGYLNHSVPGDEFGDQIKSTEFQNNLSVILSTGFLSFFR